MTLDSLLSSIFNRHQMKKFLIFMFFLNGDRCIFCYYLFQTLFFPTVHIRNCRMSGEQRVSEHEKAVFILALDADSNRTNTLST